jgi:uncharacterized protein
VMRRIGYFLLIIALWWLLRREGMANRQAFGYGIPRTEFLRQLFIGLSAGLLLMLPLVLALGLLGVRIWNVDVTILMLAKSLAEGLIAGLLTAFVEETVVRGAMFSLIERESGSVVAIVLASAIFAAVHFFQAELRIAPNEMNFLSGLRFSADIFAKFTKPLEIIDAYAALFALGTLLSMIRFRTGAIAGSIGLHAGGVAAIWVVGDCSSMNPNAEPHWLVPSYNNVVGWIAFLWISAVAIVYFITSKKRTVEKQKAILADR